MKSRLSMLAAALLASLAMAGTAVAQQGPPGPPGPPHYPPGHAYGHDHRPPPPPHRWVRGERFQDHYHGRVIVVNDYRSYRLRPPPRGYHWVRDDNNNLLLVAIATGVITDMVLNH